MANPQPAVQSREDLILLLTEAAELEQLLCLQYLFAVLTLKRRSDDCLTEAELMKVTEWAQAIYLVARQEMVHMALVNNLLNAIGGAPHFRRPNYPYPARCFPFKMELQRLTKKTLENFLFFEQPFEGQCTPEEERVFKERPYIFNREDEEEVKSLKAQHEGYHPLPYDSIAELYRFILAALEKPIIPEHQLFIGPEHAQVTGADLHLAFETLGISGVYDMTINPIRDLKSAKAAIIQIIEEGEGDFERASATPGASGNQGEMSHFERFAKILDEFEDLEEKAEKDKRCFDPAWPAVDNPMLHRHQDVWGQSWSSLDSQVTLITHPQTRKVMDVFNEVYEMLLLLLYRFFSNVDETPEEMRALNYAAFYPMMTMFIRPLGETIASMPAFEGDEEGQRAGPSFEVFPTYTMLPHKRSAWIKIYEQMTKIANQCKTLSEEPGMPDRLVLIAANMRTTAIKFKQKMNI